MNFGKGIIFALLTILVLPFVFANADWTTYANNIPNAISGNKTLFYASGYPSNHNISSPYHCSIYENPLYESLIYDINNDDNNEIIFVNDANRLQIYDFSCGIKESILVEDTVTSMPTIQKLTGKDYLVIQGQNYIHLYTNNGTNTYYEYRFPPMHTTEKYLSCFSYFDDIICSTLSTAIGNNFTAYRIEKSGSGFSYQNKTRSPFSAESLSTLKGYKTLPNAFNPSVNNYLTYFVVYGTSNKHKIIGASALSLLSPVTYPTFEPLNCTMPSATITTDTYSLGVGSLGTTTSVNALLYSGQDTITTTRALYGICDGNGNSRYLIGNASTISVGWDSSNWALADVNFDGSNEACILYNNVSLSAINSTLQCFGALYNNLVINVTLNTLVSSIGFADFDKSNNYLELITMDGIFDINSGANLNDISLYTYEQDGSLSIAVKDSNYNNFAVYSQGISLEVFGFGQLNTYTCGDSICSAFENAFNCPTDCNINNTAPADSYLQNGAITLNPAECITGYTYGNICSPKPYGISCSHNYECASETCQYSKCTTSNFLDNIRNMKNEIFGIGDSNLDNVIVIFCALLFAIVFGILGVKSGNTMALIGCAVIGAMGFVGILIFGFLVGWLSGWILAITLLFGMVFFILMLILKIAINNSND